MVVDAWMHVVMDVVMDVACMPSYIRDVFITALNCFRDNCSVVNLLVRWSAFLAPEYGRSREHRFSSADSSPCPTASLRMFAVKDYAGA